MDRINIMVSTHWESHILYLVHVQNKTVGTAWLPYSAFLPSKSPAISTGSRQSHQVKNRVTSSLTYAQLLTVLCMHYGHCSVLLCCVPTHTCMWEYIKSGQMLDTCMATWLHRHSGGVTAMNTQHVCVLAGGKTTFHFIVWATIMCWMYRITRYGTIWQDMTWK